MKLTLWYGLMCGATLGIAGFAMKTFLDGQFSRDIDTSLRNTTAEVQREISHSSVVVSAASSYGVRQCERWQGTVDAHTYCIQILNGLYNASAHLTASGQFEVVMFAAPPKDGSPPIPIGQPGLKIDQLPAPSMLLYGRVAATGNPVFIDTTTKAGDSLRVLVAPLQLPPSLTSSYGGAVEVFQNKKTYDQIKQRFDLTLLLGIPIGLLIALVAGWWISNAALRPINRISRTMRAIGESKDLTRRLRFVGPQDEVGRLAETFDGMMGRLEHAFETQKRFVADASHELRTPLTAIRGNADLMRIAPPEERDACLTAIRRESERMTRLVTDLLLLAEVDVSEQPLQMRPVQMDELLADVHRSTQLIAAGKVDVLLEASEPYCVDGDPDRLKQLLLNLADNAVKFTGAGGTVSLGLSREGSEVRIDVSDSGVGIPREEQDAIFERFYRVETSRTKRGSGLGLAICAWIVQAHGGRLSVRSEPGKGSTFSAWLPLGSQAKSDP